MSISSVTQQSEVDYEIIHISFRNVFFPIFVDDFDYSHYYSSNSGSPRVVSGDLI